MALPIKFEDLKRNFPSVNDVFRGQLLEQLGWSDVANNPAWQNTCAIRMSLALIRCGVRIQGRIQIKSGPHKGAWVEPGQGRLSRLLARSNYFGAPEKYRKQAEAARALRGRSGIISFFGIGTEDSPNLGHIDISFPLRGDVSCGSLCYWTSKEFWFWPMS